MSIGLWNLEAGSVLRSLCMNDDFILLLGVSCGSDMLLVVGLVSVAVAVVVACCCLASVRMVNSRAF